MTGIILLNLTKFICIFIFNHTDINMYYFHYLPKTFLCILFCRYAQVVHNPTRMRPIRLQNIGTANALLP